MRIVIETTGRLPTLAEIVKQYVLMVYEDNGRNKSRTAKQLGICVRTLRIRAAEWGLEPKNNDQE